MWLSERQSCPHCGTSAEKIKCVPSPTPHPRGAIAEHDCGEACWRSPRRLLAPSFARLSPVSFRTLPNKSLREAVLKQQKPQAGNAAAARPALPAPPVPPGPTPEQRQAQMAQVEHTAQESRKRKAEDPAPV